MTESPVAIVTGAASGIGRAAVELFVERGHRVVACDLTDTVHDMFAGIEAIETVVGDVVEEATNHELVARAERRWGRLDVVVLNAGVRGSGQIESIDLAIFDRAIDVNLRAVVLGMRAAIPALRRASGGSIVVTASNTGLQGEFNRFPYAAAKAGVINLCRAVAIDHAAERIRVNAVCPGPTLTGMTGDMPNEDPERYELLRRNVPMQRWADAREVAEAIVFLSSPAASFITGVALPVDGGVSANTGQAALPTNDS